MKIVIFLLLVDHKSVLPDGLRGFLNELGVFPSPKNYKYIDHFNSKNGVVQLNRDNVVEGNRLVEELSVTKYDGNAALISNNELIFPLLEVQQQDTPTKLVNRLMLTKHGPLVSKVIWQLGSKL